MNIEVWFTWSGHGYQEEQLNSSAYNTQVAELYRNVEKEKYAKLFDPIENS
jgi:hypothetical protein